MGVYFAGGEICTVGKYEASTEGTASTPSSLASLLTTGLQVSAVAHLVTDGSRRLSLRGLSAATTQRLSLSPSKSSLAVEDATASASANSSASAALPSGFTERLWAHLRIKGLLRKATATENQEEQASFEKEALTLALRYSLVTPLTSLVVVERADSASAGAADSVAQNFNAGGGVQSAPQATSSSALSAAKGISLNAIILLGSLSLSVFTCRTHR